MNTNKELISTSLASKKRIHQLVRSNLIVIVIFLLIGTAHLNWIVREFTTHQIDDEMDYQLNGFLQYSQKPYDDNPRLPLGLLPIIYIHTSEGFINPYPTPRLHQEDIDKLLALPLSEGVSTQKVNERTYRIQYRIFNNNVNYYSGTTLYKVDKTLFFRDMTNETNILNFTTLMSIAGTLVLIVIFSVLNYVFSRQAIEPINKALSKQIEFASNTSHELRNPLATIKLSAELLQKTILEEDQPKQKLVKRVLDSTDRMTYTLNDLLTIARAASAAEHAEFTQINLSKLINQLGENYCTLAEYKNADIKMNIEENLWIRGNAELLTKAFGTILDNALLYNKGSVFIHINLQFNQEKNAVQLIISDNGIGISPDDIDKVYNRFYRGSEAQKINPNGTGLGIPIAIDIAEQHKGKMHITSKPGEGTAISFLFPQA